MMGSFWFIKWNIDKEVFKLQIFWEGHNHHFYDIIFQKRGWFRDVFMAFSENLNLSEQISLKKLCIA